MKPQPKEKWDENFHRTELVVLVIMLVAIWGALWLSV